VNKWDGPIMLSKGIDWLRIRERRQLVKGQKGIIVIIRKRLRIGLGLITLNLDYISLRY
jgi:hypothetical protein